MRSRFIVATLALTGAFSIPAHGQVPGAAAKAAAQRAADAANSQLSQQTGQTVPQRAGATPSNAEIQARLRSMPSQNVAPIKTGSVPKPAGTTPQPAPAIPRAHATHRAEIKAGPETSVSSTPSGSNAPHKAAPAPAVKSVESPAVKTAAPVKTVEKPAAESLPIKRGLDTTVKQQGNPAAAVTARPVPAPKSGRDSVLIMREQFDYASDGRRDPFVSLMTTNDLRPTLSDLRLTSVLYDQSGRRPVAIMRDSVAGVQWRVTTGMTLGRMRVSSIRPRVVVFTIEEFGFSRQDSLMLRDTTRVVRSK